MLAGKPRNGGGSALNLATDRNFFWVSFVELGKTKRMGKVSSNFNRSMGNSIFPARWVFGGLCF